MVLSAGSKLCLWLIFIGSLALILGSVAPYWLVLPNGPMFGLWFHCLSKDGPCGMYEWILHTWDEYSVWFYIVHGASGLATLLAIGLIFVSLVKICGSSDSATGVAVVALFCGLLGVAAAIVVLLLDQDPAMVYTVTYRKDWAFIVFFAGACVDVIFSIALCLLPKFEDNSVHPI